MKAIFLDIETTGLDPLIHKPIDVALKIVDISDKSVVGDYQSLIFQPQEAFEKSDPISLQINGYQQADVSNGKDPQQIKGEVIELMKACGIQRGGAVFICQNPAFDRAFFIQIIDVYTQERLNWPYHWLDLASMYWAMLTQHQKEAHQPFPLELSLSKNAIARLYGLPEEGRPHRAMQGVDHLIACYHAVLSQDCQGQ